MKRDSFDKIAGYFSAITNTSFTYKSKRYDPAELYVSPLLLRGYTCPSHCGGCCFKFTLDYLPYKSRYAPDNVKERIVIFDNRAIKILSDTQEDNSDLRCKYLNKESGRCGIYQLRPFTCDFELIRFQLSQKGERNVLTQKLFGRGWNMQRIDGERGALCEMTAPTTETIEEVERKLSELRQWAYHFGLENTKIEEVEKWIRGPEINKPLILSAEGEKINKQLNLNI